MTANPVSRILPSLSVLMLVGLASGCREQPTDASALQRITLTAIDASVTETYMHVSVSEPTPGELVSVFREGLPIAVFDAMVGDTVIADTSLGQSQSYRYVATIERNGYVSGMSNETALSTLAPSNDDIQWETHLLGEGESSVAYGCCIVNDTLVVVCGEFYLMDSLGKPIYPAYNAAFLNQTSWNLKRLAFYTFCGQSHTTPYPTRSVLSWSDSDVWFFMAGTQYTRWNGEVQTDIRCLPISFGIYCAWGLSASSVYVAGTGGSLLHYDGSAWKSLESGTTTDIMDIWGTTNVISGQEEAFCAVSTYLSAGDNRILKITSGTKVDSVPWINRRSTSVWTNNGFPLFVCTHTLYENSRGQWREVATGTNAGMIRVRGTALNDVFAVGALGTIGHYDGLRWRTWTGSTGMAYSHLAVTQGTIVAVGTYLDRGLVTIGRRAH